MATYSAVNQERAEILAIRVAVIELLRVVEKSHPISGELRRLAAVGMVKPDDTPFLSNDSLVRERLTKLIDET